MKKYTLYRIDKVILVIVFCFSIYIPFLMGFIQEDKVSSGIEKRNLASHPAFPISLKEFSEYPDKFNTYYSDHFGFREALTKIYFKIINKIGVQSSVDDVTIGQDGWLFLGSIKKGYQRHDDPIGDAINVNLYTQKELQDFTRSMMTIKDWLSNKGIQYIYVIVPNKHTIYFEHLPEYLTKKNSKSSTDQLVEYLQENTDIIVVDLRQSLLDEKRNHRVYFKTDSHWNHYGVNVAQFEIMKRIRVLFPKKIVPFLVNSDQFKILSRNGGDLAEFAKIENIKEDNPQPVFQTGCSPVNEVPDITLIETHTMVCDTQELNAIIFRDSFFSDLKPYISRYFHRSTYIWERMNDTSLAKYVEQENPDIVINEVVERSLPYMLSSTLFTSVP